MDEFGALDATLTVVAKVSSLIEVLRLGCPYELVRQLWSQFTLIASRVNIDVRGPGTRCWLVSLASCSHLFVFTGLLVLCFSQSS